MDSRKIRITVQYLDYLVPLDRSDVIVVPMRAYDLVLGWPWFPKQNPDIDWARSTPCNHRVRVERRNDTDDYGSGIEGLGSRKWQASGVQYGYTVTWNNRIRRATTLPWSCHTISRTDWGMHRAAASDCGRHHRGLTRWYRPKRWTQRSESSGGSCGRRALPRRRLNDCCRLTETRREWLDGGAWLLCGRTVNNKASSIFPSTASILSRFFC